MSVPMGVYTKNGVGIIRAGRVSPFFESLDRSDVYDRYCLFVNTQKQLSGK